MPKEGSILVIGGDGFLGRRIVEQLSDRPEYSEIRVLDLRQSHFNDTKVHYFIGDITQPKTMEKAFENVQGVIHVASLPHTAPETLFSKVNVEGTQNVLNQSHKHKVEYLVFTSSASVVFNGQPLIMADETLPYPNYFLEKYTETKAIAEQCVLNANDPKGLKTCSIRPSAIFGPGDRQQLPAMIQMYRKGFSFLQIGNNSTLFDFTFVDNVAHAHILAALKLKNMDSKIYGQAFFITNDNPIAFWDYSNSVWKLMGKTSGRKLILSKDFLLTILNGVEVVMKLLSPFIHTPQNLTLKINLITQYRCFDISKAKELLGYTPLVPLDKALKISMEHFLHLENGE